MSNQHKPPSRNRFENLVSYLLERYQQAEGYERSRVIKAIAIYDDPRVIPFAVEIVKQGHPDDAAATEALKLLAKRRYEGIVPIVADMVAGECISSQWLLCLGRIGNEAAQEIICPYLRHRDTMLRGSAMFALALIAREQDHALEILSTLVDDPVSTIRSDAINALSVVGKRAIYILVMLTHSDHRTTQQAITILGEMKAKQAIPHLIPFLLHHDTVAKQRLADAAARALKFIGTPGALAALDAWKASQDVS